MYSYSLRDLSTTLLVLATLSISNQAFSQDQSLIGCWRSLKVVQYFGDGTNRQNQSNKCSSEFKESEIVSLCSDSKIQTVIGYSYHVSKPGTYVATLSSHNLRTDLVGGTREYNYRIDSEKLFIITYPQSTKPTPSSAAIRVESISIRTPCDKG